MTISKTKSVFGPIPSRRLGLSLGIDLLPFKTCSMDCVYCECGATTNLTLERAEYFPTETVISEIDSVMAEKRKIDFVTFSGVGEPTLHTGTGAIIAHLKKTYPEVKVCVLTNGTLLGDASVQRELSAADLVVPSLDGSDEEEFRKINRPVAGFTLEKLVDALVSFRHVNPAVPMYLEVFIVPGVNDSRMSIERFRKIIQKIAPDKVQLNSLDRPGVEDWIKVPPREELEDIASHLACGVPIEIISRTAPVNTVESESGLSVAEYNARILKTLESRPCTAQDIALAANCDFAMTCSHLRRLERAGLLVSEEGPRGRYYRKAR